MSATNPTAEPTVVVLTALPLEYDAVRRHIVDVEEKVHAKGTWIEVGRLPDTPWKIAIAELGEGSTNAAVLTERILEWVNPDALFFVGVAGSLKSDIKIGDVVVGTKVYGIHSGKQTAAGFLVRPEAWRSSHRLEQAARFALRGRMHPKPIAVGDIVLADAKSAISEHLRQHYNDAAAIEMEGMGVVHAAHLSDQVDALVIRGISDYADVGKSRADASGSQPKAARQAAAALVGILRKLQPFRERTRASIYASSGRSDSAGGSEDSLVGLHQLPVPPHVEAATSASSKTPPVATAALPAAPAGFTGRDEELTRLFSILDPAAEPDLPVVICAVSGLGGIGKTSLALHAAHRAAKEGWFPGGTLFVDFRGYDKEPITAEQALAALLDKLGVHGPDLPATPTAQFERYRALLAEQREPILLILDNASDPAQLIPLIPGTERHRVLITSRSRLTDLDARLIDLDTLSSTDSLNLIDKSLRITDERDDRVTREPEHAAELIRLCGHYPLALQITAGMLRKRRFRTLASLAHELQHVEDRTAALGVRALLATAYRQLPPAQAKLFRFLCMAPGTEVSSETAAALAGLVRDETFALLEDLTAAHLVTPVPTGHTMMWRLHDLVRAYGANVTASNLDAVEENDMARERVLNFYCQRAREAEALRRGVVRAPGSEEFTDRTAALTWLDQERLGLVTAAQWASEDRYAPNAIRLALHLMDYKLNWRHHFDDWAAISRIAWQAAYDLGDRVAAARLLNSHGFALRELGHAREAMNAHTRALDLYRTTDHPHGAASALHNIGLALQGLGRMEESIDTLSRAHDLHKESGYITGEAAALHNLGSALLKEGRSAEAIDAFTEARDLHRQIGDLAGEADALTSLGNALRMQRRGDEAVVALNSAVHLYQEIRGWNGVGMALLSLARLHEEAESPSKARTFYCQAADAYTKANAPEQAARAQASAQALT